MTAGGTTGRVHAGGARRQLFSSGLWVALSSFAPFLATAALSVVAGRVLGAEVLGQQSYIAFAGALLSAVLVGSLTDASIQGLSSRSGEPLALAALRRWSLAAHAAAGLLVAVLLAAYGLRRGEYSTAWLLMAGCSLLNALGWGWAARSIAATGWAPVARRRLVSQLAAIVLGTLAVVAGLGVPGIFGAEALAAAGLLAALVRLAPAPGPEAGLSWPAPVGRLWGMFAAGAVLTQVVGRRIEFLFLGAWSDGAQIAAFSIAVMVGSAVVMLPAALSGAVVPAVAAAAGAGDEQRAAASLGSALRVVAAASLPLAALLVAAGPPLVLGVYGDGFRQAASLVPLVAVAVVSVPVGQLCSAYWSGLGRLRVPLVTGALGGGVDLVLAALLVRAHGAVGAVTASVAGQTVAAVGVVVLTWRVTGRPRLHPGTWAAGAVAAACGALLGRLAAGTCSGLPAAVLAGCACTAGYVAAAAVLRRLRLPLLCPDDAGWLRATLPGRAAGLVGLLGR